MSFQRFLIGEECSTDLTFVAVIFIVRLELFLLGKSLATNMAEEPRCLVSIFRGLWARQHKESICSWISEIGTSFNPGTISTLYPAIH
jgi:hypothetical protein